jgi:restriction system protein
MKVNVWLLRPLPHGTNHMKDFLEDDFIAVGYPVGMELSQYDYGQIRKILRQHNMEEGIGNVNILVHEMQKGDYVIVPDDNKKDVYVCRVASDYHYVQNLDIDEKGLGYPHQRKVEWLFDKKALLRSELPEELKGSMRYPGAVADLTKHYDVIKKVINGTPVIDTPLEERAFEVVKEMLNSKDPHLRLKAAEIILKK